MKILYPPEHFEPSGSFWDSANPPTIFLGGTIDMGNSRDWQTEFANRFEGTDYIFLNPRRKEWDSSWEQSIHNSHFRDQVEWELANQETATFRVFNLLAGSASPVTLLEIGLFARKNSFVCCPKGYHRHGNIEIVCNRYQIPLCQTEDELAELLRKAVDDELDHRQQQAKLLEVKNSFRATGGDEL